MELLFVCLGNICRSPTAEGVMTSLVSNAGLEAHVTCDSAGTGGWHVGDLPDRRARAEARRRGLELTHRGWQVRGPADLERFDLVLAMDHQNLRDLRRIAPKGWDGDRLALLRAFEPGGSAGPALDVPDPYYGDADDFAEVFDICLVACRGLLDHVRAALGPEEPDR